jgi:hypothetical protein
MMPVKIPAPRTATMTAPFDPDMTLRQFFTHVQQAASELAEERGWDDETRLYSARQMYGLLAKGVLNASRQLRMPAPALDEVARTSLKLAEYPMLSTAAAVSARLKQKGVIPRDIGKSREHDGSFEEDMAERIKDAPIREAMGLLAFRVDGIPNHPVAAPNSDARASDSREHEELMRRARQAVEKAMEQEQAPDAEHEALLTRAFKARNEGRPLTAEEEEALRAEREYAIRTVNRASRNMSSQTAPVADMTPEGIAQRTAAEMRRGAIMALVASLVVLALWLFLR